MKIIIVAPKTITPHRHSELRSLIKEKKPDLLFCITAGDSNYTPFEPWKTIRNETQKGNIKTFNWFCDDSWRFESFSSQVCNFFHICSTPEPSKVESYHSIGYKNIFYANWHANSDFYSHLNIPRKNEIAFLGAPRGDRKLFLEALKENNIPIKHPQFASFEDLVETYSRSLIGINFSRNPANRTPQMKARLFEIPAAGGMLLTEHSKDIEKVFVPDKEIITFKTEEEMLLKAKHLLANPKLATKIAANGFKKFMREHESKVRLAQVIEKIKEI